MRVYALYTVVAALCVYAWRNWFYSLCGLIVLMAFIQHEDMPKSIGDVQGLNPWNILLVFVILSWAVHRRHEGLVWDLPRPVTVLLLLYLGVVLVGFGRMMVDLKHMGSDSISTLISEQLINTVKWVIPGLLLFDGCRTRRRLVVALLALTVLYSAVALQLAYRLPTSCAIGGGEETQHIRLKITSELGYSTCDMSTMLAGASWAFLAFLPLARKNWQKALIIGGVLLVTYGQALTGGRAGYLAWGAVGLIMCLVKWRKYLFLAPIVPLLLYVVFPASAERMLEGFSSQNVAGETTTDDYAVTSGRSLAWPFVIDKIGESPGFGYGREAMVRTGLMGLIQTQYPGENFPHPHNAYLEWLLDNGIVGLLPLIGFFGFAIYCSARLFRDGNPYLAAAGGMALALLLAQLLGGIGAQHFYPRESALGMWAALFLMFRAYVERTRSTKLAGKQFLPARRSYPVSRLFVTR